ncbi:MAG TPA: FAD-dependent monooxygenase [Gemmatimonadaceae bacterium]
MTDHAVLIAGAGPTGLTLAAELALAGVDVAVVERRPNQDLAGSRAGGLHARTIEMFDQRGIADRFLSKGQVAQVASFGWIRLDISDFPSRYPHGLGLWQNQIEHILAEWVRELRVPVHYGLEVTGFAQDETGVNVQLSSGRSMRAEYLVGCDGGRSLVRRTAGIEFPGWDPTTSSLIAEAEMAEQPELGIRRDALGVHGFGRVEYEIRDGQVVFKDHGPIRIVVPDTQTGATSEPTLDDLRQALIAVYGTDYGVHSPTSISRFTDITRQAARYRDRRVLLAGDAAHVHYPVGGQGLNIGVQDAMNLGWKLAEVVKHISPDTLLDTYHAERHPVAARVLRNTMAQVALLRPDDRTEALREFMAEVLAMDEPRKRFGAMMSGLDIRYDLGEGHPLIGRRMPDLDLVTTDGPRRTYALLRNARPVLLNLGETDPTDHRGSPFLSSRGGEAKACPEERERRGEGPSHPTSWLAMSEAVDIAPWCDRIRAVDASYDGAWELPVLGAVDPPAAVLIRPDGYVAWAGDPTSPDLIAALTTWCGPA